MTVFLLARLALALALTSLALPSNAGAAQQPQADPAVVIQRDQVRLTVLTSRLIRLEYAEDRRFTDAATQVVLNRKLEVPAFQTSSEQGWLVLKTEHLTLRYREHSGDFTADNLNITLRLNGRDVEWRPGMQDNANLGGTARTLDGLDGGVDADGKQLDLGRGLLSRGGWSLVDDTASHLLDDSPWPWVRQRAIHGKDWYFFGHGHDYKAALRDYIAVAGKIPLPPRFAFGYWWSRYWVYSDQELKQLMQEMRNNDIPIDVLVIDMDWHLTHGGLKDIRNPELDPLGELLGWTGYTWNRDLFPEPKKFLDWTKAFPLKTALNLHPASGIPPMEEQYQRFAQRYGFDTSKRDYIPYRMEEKRWTETYTAEVLRPLERQGVDFWWLDWQQYPQSRAIAGLDNTWWLNYVFFTDMERQGKRPLLFHRWGGMGNHRYQIGFSGDDKISWASLDYQSYFTATAANVGYGYWSHDIGGHAASALSADPELYLRWLQFGVLSPILRTHSAKISSIERRFWMYPQHLPEMRKLIKLRYALNPYIYTAARQAYDQGVSIVRPMYLEYPEQDQAYQFKHQYLFGDDMLVAPVASPVDRQTLVADKTLWLPPGQWYEWSTGATLEGGRTLKRQYALNELPLWIKAGAIVPMYPELQHLQGKVDGLVLTVLPGAAGSTRIYEDGGEGLGYQQREHASTVVRHRLNAAGQRAITVLSREGSYQGAPAARSVTLVLRSTLPAEGVTVNGKPLARSEQGPGWSYDGKTLSNVIRLSKRSTREKLEVVVSSAHSSAQQQQAVNGKLGMFARLSEATAQLKIEVARSNWWATLPQSVLGAEQTASKIAYQPQDALALLQQFDRNYPRMLEEIAVLADADPAVAARYVKFLSPQEN
ncbi:TIM-barrel domain-containing protein [Duganella sp. BuS-21]|uniref:glycoside hydrolase family 31 protein n=1 Tax=Duganella sp. BuS-21 TaxID=2943848 RepID=UPI0035A6E71A